MGAAAKEFLNGDYRWVIGTGLYSSEIGNEPRWSYAEVAVDNLLYSGVPKEKIIAAPAADVEEHRTYESALAVSKVLKALDPKPRSVTVFTRGAHARRSRLVYAKVLGADFNVGVVAWFPPGTESTCWWHSSGRAREFIVETVAWAYELLLNSGRSTHQRDDAP